MDRGECLVIIPQIPFFGLDINQIDTLWVDSGYGLEANIFNGNSFFEEGFNYKFKDVLSYVKSLNPSLLTLHFPTDNADYINSDSIKKKLYEFIDIATKFESKGIVLHANQFLSVDEFQNYNLTDNRKRIIEFFASLDEYLKDSSLWVGIENLPIIGNKGDDFDPIFVYPKDFDGLNKLNLNNVGITWDICHWSITYLTHLSVSRLYRDRKFSLNNYFEFLNLENYIKHYHFSSFKHLTIPYSDTQCIEGKTPENGSIDVSLLKQSLLKIKNSIKDKDIGMAFEVQETDYSNRTSSWDTLKWFEEVIT